MTKETEKAFKILYCEYKSRRKAGESKTQAIYFEDAAIRNIPGFQKWIPEDIDFAVHELMVNQFVSCDICGGVTLLESGLTFMEDKPKEFWKDLSGLFDLITLFG